MTELDEYDSSELISELEDRGRHGGTNRGRSRGQIRARPLRTSQGLPTLALAQLPLRYSRVQPPRYRR